MIIAVKKSWLSSHVHEKIYLVSNTPLGGPKCQNSFMIRIILDVIHKCFISLFQSKNVYYKYVANILNLKFLIYDV